MPSKPLRILYVEPFLGGSHAQFTQDLLKLKHDFSLLSLPGKYWKWRALGSSAYFSLKYPEILQEEYDLVFASSFTPLSDLVALNPQLATIPKLLYFHENQLAYPIQESQAQERDNTYGFQQMVSGLVADRIVFNSSYNQESFFSEARSLLKRLPDKVPPGWVEQLQAKSQVLPLPLFLEPAPTHFAAPGPSERQLGPMILWNHRWEHDKAPELFFEALFELQAQGHPFRLCVCGQAYQKKPQIFKEARQRLSQEIVQFGPLHSRETYLSWLRRADIAVSTARHEFFGISMLEAAHFGAYPLVPDALAYPERFAEHYRYPPGQLLETILPLLESYRRGEPLRADRQQLTQDLGQQTLDRYQQLFTEMVA